MFGQCFGDGFGTHLGIFGRFGVVWGVVVYVFDIICDGKILSNNTYATIFSQNLWSHSEASRSVETLYETIHVASSADLIYTSISMKTSAGLISLSVFFPKRDQSALGHKTLPDVLPNVDQVFGQIVGQILTRFLTRRFIDPNRRDYEFER